MVSRRRTELLKKGSKCSGEERTWRIDENAKDLLCDQNLIANLIAYPKAQILLAITSSKLPE